MLAQWFKLPRFKTIGTLILANYVSAWGGMLIAASTLPRLSFVTLENIHVWRWFFAAFLFLVTLVIEYPFFRFSLRKKPESLDKTIKALLVIHGISYLLVASWYVANSQASMLTQLARVSVDRLNLPEQYQLYFKSQNGMQLMRSDLTGNHATAVSAREFQAQLSSASRDSDQGERRLRPPHPRRAYFYQPIPKLAEDSDWDFYIHMMADRGIVGLRDRNLGQFEFEFILETPFARWPVRHATHLAGDFVVFQLGADQICILHPHDRLISLVTRGMEPFVVPVE